MGKNKDSNEQLCAILSYLFVGIIWYFADEKIKKSSFVKFHVKQALILIIAEIIYSVLIGILFWPIVLISFGVLYPLMRLLYAVPLVWVVIGIINAINYREIYLPLIGKFAKKFNF